MSLAAHPRIVFGSYFKFSFALCSVVLAEGGSIDSPIHCADEAGTTYDIAERDRHKIVNDARIVMTDASKSAGTLPVRVINQAKGRKYMLATQCSKPAAMKAETGNTAQQPCR